MQRLLDEARTKFRRFEGEEVAATYGEQQRMVAVNGSSVLEFWGNEDASTWTLIVTYPDGVSCVLGAGIGFAVADEGPVGEAM